MTLLTRNTTPAERARGCVFSELFRDQASVLRNGGVLTGTPVIDKGVTLDGLTQSLAYHEPSSYFVGDSISFVIEFYPVYAANTDHDEYLFAGDGDYYVRKLDLAGSYDLRIRLGNTTTENIPIATYGSYWLAGQRNQIAVSSTSGDTKVWLNGVLVSNAATVWNPTEVIVFDIGIRSATGGRFAGTISKFQIYNRKLTAQEVADFYNGTVYDYRNQQSLHLPMGMDQHDPSNVRTLDVSGNARHATFGDGVTPTTYPTKLGDRHGYDFDGGSDYMTVVGTGVYNSAETTIAVEFWPDREDTIYLFDSTNLNRYLCYLTGTGRISIFFGQTEILSVDRANYQEYWHKGGQNLIVMTGKTGENNLWLNGVQLVENGSVAWTAKDPSELFIGTAYNFSIKNNGRMASFQVWQSILTPLQIMDLTIRSGIKVNNV